VNVKESVEAITEIEHAATRKPMNSQIGKPGEYPLPVSAGPGFRLNSEHFRPIFPFNDTHFLRCGELKRQTRSHVIERRTEFRKQS
jgi:hypothetical protein